ncbi:MAG: pyridoxine 5'-phosphate synthase [Gemmatales bacterium]|nr:pyridoxine 5'-phosphate synthase [Gemmatales bacterium]MDW7993793.1 pyridoxine 5'-phosphate synthase [Gemmatales bacterium]
MIRLGVNVDHVATVRQARRAREPDPVWAAMEAQLGGADGITVHLREDRRHIQERDVRLLRELVAVRLNLEMSLAEDIVRFACEVCPDEATIVPERRQELTTEGGLDVVGHEDRVQQVVKRLRERGILVSLFIEPDVRQIECARLVGAQAVEFHTGRYAHASNPEERQRELEMLIEAARYAHEAGLHVHMGHGLNYANVCAIAAIPQVEELNIGHSIVARAIFVGMRQAVREMKELICRARRPGA